MNKVDAVAVLIIAAAIVLGFTVGCLMTHRLNKKSIFNDKELIERGIIQHNVKTGELEYVGGDDE